eukprot:3941035-Rhodomonas_salina.1
MPLPGGSGPCAYSTAGTKPLCIIAVHIRHALSDCAGCFVPPKVSDSAIRSADIRRLHRQSVLTKGMSTSGGWQSGRSGSRARRRGSTSCASSGSGRPAPPTPPTSSSSRAPSASASTQDCAAQRIE